MKRIPFYPFLFAINPILLLFSANVSEIELSVIFPGIFYPPLISGFLFYLLITRKINIHRAAFNIFLAIVWFFHYQIVQLLISFIFLGKFSETFRWIFLGLWCVIFLFIGSGYVWRKIKNLLIVTSFMNLLGIILVIYSIGRVIIDIFPRYITQPISREIQLAFPDQLVNQNPPDIYYIILDGYARDDVLFDIYDFNNQYFIQALGQRGFQIPKESQSNYMQTALSLASSLNLEYLTGIASYTPDRGQLIGKIHHNQVRYVLESFGYDFISFSTGYLPTSISDADIFLKPPGLGRGHNFDALILNNSILNPFITSGLIDVPVDRYGDQQIRIAYIFQTMRNLSDSNSPRFIFAHIVVPHQPFIYDENGPITPETHYSLTDGADEYLEKYAAQVFYVNKLLLETINSILNNDRELPIIILQADHGSGAYLSYTSAMDTCLYERFAIFSAFFLPGKPIAEVPENITPVNIFRFIFNQYFGSNFELLENNIFYSPWEKPYQFTDVTEQITNDCSGFK